MSYGFLFAALRLWEMSMVKQDNRTFEQLCPGTLTWRCCVPPIQNRFHNAWTLRNFSRKDAKLQRTRRPRQHSNHKRRKFDLLLRYSSTEEDTRHWFTPGVLLSTLVYLSVPSVTSKFDLNQPLIPVPLANPRTPLPPPPMVSR